ncbi:guanylate kinase [Crenobacter sp. SG2303]|uniref:Guanylate kinase n=1 Tax=Crenobacter oryzisoli TaxID=3056844 RepID=A0ABT7XUC9_9NEIS|nr:MULTISPECIES: guanylate kinase [unclassified Crenobacter]MDN0077384.1 guanylate kinase [Crenobacter sp. SG2303]MDN0085460.1 guanylate kinase [Crenobacter sp. SG2305]
MVQLSGNIFIVTAPSGAGKTTLVAALLAAERAVQHSVSYTTRAPREGEVEGRHYHFVTREDFEARIERGEFLEYAEVYGNYYGTSATWIRERLAEGRDILLEIDWQGAQQVHKLFPDAVSIFILPPSLEELESRLRGRGTDSDEVIARRLAMARSEIDHAETFDYILINDDLGTATLDLISVVRAERLRPARQLARHGDVLMQLHTPG